MKLKLPKDVVADPRHEAILARLNQHTQPLWAEGTRQVPTLTFTPALAEELKLSLGRHLALQGLEQIERELEREKIGLDALAKKSPESIQGGRISRILLIANDGAERFYRECDTLLFRHSDRLMVCKIDKTGAELGEALLDAPKLLRAVLISDKKAAARLLLTLA